MKIPVHDIVHLKRKDIDIRKWDQTVQNSINSRIYALSAWLDIVSPGWEALVTGDYEYIMPLTPKKKYGIRYLAQPLFTQQLGLFSTHAIDIRLAEKYIDMARSLYPFAEIAVNFNGTGTGAFLPKKNYCLSLQPSCHELRSAYRKKLLYAVNNAERAGLLYTAATDADRVISLYRELYQHRVGLKGPAYDVLKQLSSTFLSENKCIIREIITPQNQLIAGAILFKDRHRLYQVIACSNEQGRRVNAHHYLIDNLIGEFAGKPLVLDFEGSNIPGVAFFNTSFGAVLEPYYFLKWNQLPWPLQLLKR